MTTKVIQTSHLSKSYGKTKAVSNLNLEVDKGEFFGFLGPNGAGKTTTIKILTSQIAPDSGEAAVLGINIKDSLTVKRAVGVVPEIVMLPSFLTVSEYLEFVSKIRAIEPEKIEFWLDLTDLSEKRNALCKDLSQGMKQKLSFAAAFIHDPKLVFLDEPFADVDPLMQNTLKTFLKEYVKKGGTIFLSTHILEIAEKLCSRIAIITKGNIATAGTIPELLKKGETLEEVFLTLVRSHG
ncbi:MAG: ABC transporter ATP-binding protein [Theionarchaea archaeon]|nr:MAG: ABC transporter ATP-binding protein [Theionarchaea archaeon DG-70-1]MBU7026778.1 ABC transporter ATP-binding protein [Theionarchaea archaeon]